MELNAFDPVTGNDSTDKPVEAAENVISFLSKTNKWGVCDKTFNSTMPSMVNLYMINNYC